MNKSLKFSRRFIVKKRQEYGGLGLQLIGSDFMEPLQGMTVAHDIMEHFPEDTGEVHQEFMATGAMMFGRGLHGGMFRNGRSPGVNASADYGFVVWRYMRETGKRLKPFGKRSVHVAEPEVESWLEDILHTAPSVIMEEAENDLEGMTTSERKAFEREARKLVMDSLPWIRHGFRKARDRYRGADSYDIGETFRDIERKVDSFLKGRGEMEPHDGLEVTVHVDIRQHRAFIEVEYPDYDDEN